MEADSLPAADARVESLPPVDLPPVDAAEVDDAATVDSLPPVTQSDHWNRSIGELSANITESPGEAQPTDYSIRLFARGVVERTGDMDDRPASLFMWAPPVLYHWPLYFEDAQLERYGQTYSPTFQPVFSGVRFLTDFTLVPLQMLLDPPFSCVTNLGYYRPGSPLPCHRQMMSSQPHSPLPAPLRRSADRPSSKLARLPETGAL
jgi:hypothetical protein